MVGTTFIPRNIGPFVPHPPPAAIPLFPPIINIPPAIINVLAPAAPAAPLPPYVPPMVIPPDPVDVFMNNLLYAFGINNTAGEDIYPRDRPAWIQYVTILLSGAFLSRTSIAFIVWLILLEIGLLGHPGLKGPTNMSLIQHTILGALLLERQWIPALFLTIKLFTVDVYLNDWGDDGFRDRWLVDLVSNVGARVVFVFGIGSLVQALRIVFKKSRFLSNWALAAYILIFTLSIRPYV